MKLDDEQIERYSRQLVLQEIGPRGQERLGAARVAVVGDGAAAERAIAYLAAAGIGTIVADPALRAAVDPDQRDCTFTALVADTLTTVDAVVVTAHTIDGAADVLTAWYAHASTCFWIAGAHAGAFPPCPRCATADLPSPPAFPPLAGIREAVLGTIVATEVVKALLAIGTGLGGRLLSYDPATATVESGIVPPRDACRCHAFHH